MVYLILLKRGRQVRVSMSQWCDWPFRGSAGNAIFDKVGKIGYEYGPRHVEFCWHCGVWDTSVLMRVADSDGRAIGKAVCVCIVCEFVMLMCVWRAESGEDTKSNVGISCELEERAGRCCVTPCNFHFNFTVPAVFDPLEATLLYSRLIDSFGYKNSSCL